MQAPIKKYFQTVLKIVSKFLVQKRSLPNENPSYTVKE